MANKSLIAGAAAMYSTQGFIDPGQAMFTPAQQNAYAQMEAQMMAERRAKKNKIDASMRSFINQMPENVSLDVVPEKQRGTVTRFLAEKKKEYGDLAMQLSQMDATDPNYMELADQLNTTKKSFETLTSQLKSFKQDREAAIVDFDSGLVSEGNNIYDLDFSTKVYKGDAIMNINSDGSISFYNEANNNFTNYTDMPSYFNKDYDSAKQIMNLSNNIYKSGELLSGHNKDMVKMQLMDLIKSGGIETARSLAVDDFIMDGGLGIQNQDLLFNPERAEELQKTVVDSYMSMFDKVARDGYNKKLSKIKAPTLSKQFPDGMDFPTSKDESAYMQGQLKAKQIKEKLKNNDSVIIGDTSVGAINIIKAKQTGVGEDAGKINYQVKIQSLDKDDKPVEETLIFENEKQLLENILLYYNEANPYFEEGYNKALNTATATTTAEELMKKYGKKE